MSDNYGWVRGLIPGQPEWVYDVLVAEFDRYDARVAELQKTIGDIRSGGESKYSDILSDGGMDPRNSK